MKASVSISSLKRSLSTWMEQVRAGATLVVTDRGVPVALIAPLARVEEEPEAMRALVRSGQVTPPGAILPPEFFTAPRGQDPQGRIRQFLLSEREEGW
jgi:prevent-host-death family protein